MMNLTSVQKGGSQYLVYDLITSPHKIDNDTIMMINSNQANDLGLAKISFEDINGEKQKMLFDITGMMSLVEFLNRRMSQEAFRQLILQLVETIDNFDNYMIDLRQVYLNIDYVYVNYIEKRIVFLCMPFADSECPENIGVYEFFRAVCNMSFSNVEYDGHTSYQNIVVNALNSKAAFSLNNLRSVLNPGSSQPSQAKSAVVQPTGSSFREEPPKPVSPVGDVVFNGPAPTADQSVSGVPMIEMPKADTKDSGSLLGKMKDILKKPGESKKPASPKKEKAPKAGKSSFTGGLAGLSGLGKKSESAVQVPPVPGLQVTVPTQPQQVIQPVQQTADQQVSANMSAAEDKCHTIYVSDEEAAFEAPAAGSERRVNAAMQNLFDDIPSGFGSEPVNNSSVQQNLGGSGILSGGMFDSSGVQPAVASAPVEVRKSEPSLQQNAEMTVMMSKARVIHVRTGKETRLETPVVRVGRSSKDVEIRLSESIYVGRYHAEFRRRGTDYVLVDMQSSNHTFLNGTQIVPDREYPLSDGDQIVFADEKFEYRVEF